MIPRQFLQHDQVWNLALAHSFCNLQKSDALPDPPYISKLIARNEDLVVSNHPLKNEIIPALGTSASKRRKQIERVYEDATVALRVTWSGVRGYDPATDPFYKRFLGHCLLKAAQPLA